ncbi:MAG TPA: hypothetical protein VHP35_12960 [Terriglobia bacterium]|nr:hypothetical protein [Terriglobia bacterium]
MQPLFLSLALVSMVYQVWAVRARPPFLRTRGVKTILHVSLTINTLVIFGWVFLYIRYY